MNRDHHLAHHTLGPVPGFASAEAVPRYAPDLRIEPTHIEIHVHLLFEESAADCRVITTVKTRSPGHRSFLLDAIGFQIHTVQDPDGHALNWTYDGRVLQVTWSEAAETGDIRRVEVAYRVSNPLTGLVFQGPTDQHPERARLAVTDHETQRARYWLPCVDHPAVRTCLDIHIRSHADHEILATGELVSSRGHEDGSRTAHWKLERPCPAYLLCMAVGEFVRAEGGSHQGHPIAFFAPPPSTAEDLQRSFSGTAQMLAWMTQRLGAPLPYPKYYQFAAPGIGGAMENISLVSWDDLWVADERFRAEMGWLIDLVNVHEMAHTWFGDAVVIRDYAHAWLKESWATYIEVVWQEETQDIDTAHHHLAQKARSYITESDQRYARPIVTRHFDSGWDMFDHHLYPGGAWRLHMLRHRLGDAVFWPAVSDYLARYSDKVVETADFRRILEEHSGQSLADFFDQWLYSPGYPKLKATYSHDMETQQTRLVIEQTQQDKAKGVGLFHFALEVAVEDAEGTWSRHSVEIDGKRQVLCWRASTRSRQVILDPDMKVLFSLDFSPGEDMLKHSLLHAPTVAGRLQAIHTLAKQGTRSGIKALEAAFRTEKHWGVRADIARCLGDAGTYAAAGSLARMLRTETDVRIMLPLCIAAGQYRDERIAQALETWLQSEQPYRASAEALVALGKQRKPRHLPTLRGFAADKGWWGWVRRGALLGLGQSRLPEVSPDIMEVAKNSAEPVQVRTAAVQALAIHSSWQDRGLKDQTCEALADLCRDPVYSVRLAAGRALIGTGDRRHAHVLEALCTQLAVQDAPAIQRGIAGLGAAAELSKTRALEDKLSRLSERLVKLQNRVDDLAAEASPKA